MNMHVGVIEQGYRDRYALAKSNLMRPPIFLQDEARRRRDEKARMAQESFDRFIRRGTGAGFIMKNPVSYWFEGIHEPKKIMRCKEMYEIAEEVLEPYATLSIDALRKFNSTPFFSRRREEIVRAIHQQRPDISFAEIGRFMNRDHTSICALLGTLSARRKKESA
jgi:hypothetical protein